MRYADWREQADAGEAAWFTISVADALDVMERALLGAEAVEDEEDAEEDEEDDRLFLSEENPYGSMEAVVDDDGRAIYLYLRPLDEDVASMKHVWVANVVDAPPEADPSCMEAGMPPLMPRAGTRFPEGWPAPPAEELSLVWFEEGDGVALLHEDRPIAVLPPWAGPETTWGYSWAAIGQQDLAWELDSEALQGLGPRIEAARRYWEWRSTDESWEEIRDAGIAHLEARLGAVQRYWAADGGQFPPRAVVLLRPPATPGISVYATVGMSAQAMPQVECAFEDPAPYRRIELVLATRRESDDLGSTLSGMMAMPWQQLTWLGNGHTYSWGADGPQPGAALLLADPPAEAASGGLIRRVAPVPAPDLSGLRDRSGDPVHYLWVLPITPAEVRLAEERGSAELARRIAGRGWVWR